ncbi:DUF4082 domain-containing protein [Microbispora sp. RL4-1S]|uniref:DUF4082 domain-containing protein n=1 Tax=Microbispora oryzae TaxID=2806554 RepID=A0A940WS21_9ACTN|nr:DUF4082 domain-containing protein [Microbispora oryzae]MBP2706410.1 DUF4082 domain-containing protein [Microbispora oryzae]
MAPIKHPRHGARSGYARALRRLARPRPALLVATALVAAAIPAIFVAARFTGGSAPAPTPVAQPRMTLQARETSLWSAGDRSGPPVHVDRAPVELGTRFTAAEDGWVTGVRFFKARGEQGTHTGTLWSSRGTRLATVAFEGESRSGWQEARFGKAVPVEAGKVYTVSYHSEHGTYVGRPSSRTLRSGPLSTAARRVGVYSYGASRFPKRWNPKDYNYYVGPIYRWLERRPAPATGPGTGPVASASPSGEVAEVTPSLRPSAPRLSPDPSDEPYAEPSLDPFLDPSVPQSTDPFTDPFTEPSVGASPAGPSAEPTTAPSPAMRPSSAP